MEMGKKSFLCGTNKMFPSIKKCTNQMVLQYHTEELYIDTEKMHYSLYWQKSKEEQKKKS